MIRYYVQGFPGAFYECSEWLAQVFVPWRWVVVFYEECQHVRQQTTAVR
jgi:hypothetical protein